MSRLLLIFVIVYGFIHANSQGVATARTIRAVYADLTKQSDYIFIADTTLSVPLLFEDLVGSFPLEDTSLVKLILAKGKAQALTRSTIDSILFGRGRFLNKQTFSTLRPRIELTPKEGWTVRTLDSIGYVRSKLPVNSSQYKELLEVEKGLEASTEFKSILVQREKADKRLLFFYPLIEYQQYSILAIGCWQSRTNAYSIVKVISSQ